MRAVSASPSPKLNDLMACYRRHLGGPLIWINSHCAVSVAHYGIRASDNDRSLVSARYDAKYVRYWGATKVLSGCSTIRMSELGPVFN